MGGVRVLGTGVAIAALVSAGAAAAAGAKDAKAAPPKQSAGAAYIDQIGAPGDWKTNAGFWAGLTTSIPASASTASTLKLVIADPGNTAKQVQSGAGEREFIMQWGTRNTATQALSGSANRAEAVQISPGATRYAKANAGAGNGTELDIFGFEVDPGNSQADNRSPEGGAGPPAGWQGNVALQQATGTQNVARTVQIGWSNFAEQVQDGTANQSVIVQIGSGNRAENAQSGARELSTIVQQGTGNTAIVRQ